MHAAPRTLCVASLQRVQPDGWALRRLTLANSVADSPVRRRSCAGGTAAELFGTSIDDSDLHRPALNPHSAISRWRCLGDRNRSPIELYPSSAMQAGRLPFRSPEIATRPRALVDRSAFSTWGAPPAGSINSTSRSSSCRISCIFREIRWENSPDVPSAWSKGASWMLSTPPMAAESASVVRRSRLTWASRRDLFRVPARAWTAVFGAAIGKTKCPQALAPKAA